jgi:nucleotide-binding universal stress UspA family protein
VTPDVRPDALTHAKTVQTWPELLVPFDGSHGAEKVLRRACRAARRDGAELTVLCMVQMATDDEEAWGDPDLDATALLALTRAQAICREEGVVAVFELNHGRNLADAIVQEARRSGAGLICLSLEEHELGETALMSETVQAVLTSAPCSVLLDNPATELLPPRPSRFS